MKLPEVSLRGRLTAWHALILGLVLICFSVGVYLLLARSLSQEIDRSLVDRAAQVSDAIPPTLQSFSNEAPADVLIPPPPNFAFADTFVQVTGPDGRILRSSENLNGEALPVGPEDLATLRTGQERLTEARLGGERIRLYSVPLLAQGRPVVLIQVARSLEPLDASLARLRLFAGIGLFFSLGLSGLVVWFATGAALRPLEGMVETAEAIGSSRDLRGRRVEPTASKDEVGRLAATFNGMLERLAASDAGLREANARLAGSLEAQRRFVADASHELRTPLTTIRGNAELLRRVADVTPEDHAQALAQIDREAGRMSRLVGDLLTLARADAGKSLAHAPVALGSLLEDAAVGLRRFAGGRSLTVEIPQPVTIDGDEDALKQLALILLDNAIRYTTPDGCILARLDASDGEARLVVRDTGIGIPPDDLPHVFERFYRADRGRKSGGTGLGLSIALWISEMHGGTIEAESKHGKGSCFTVRLPLNAAS